jgi:hypothetical protein
MSYLPGLALIFSIAETRSVLVYLSYLRLRSRHTSKHSEVLKDTHNLSNVSMSCSLSQYLLFIRLLDSVFVCL